MVVLNDDRLEPLAASQFQPPSGSCSASSRSTMPPDVLAEVGAGRPDLPVDAGLQLAFKESIAVTFLRAASPPGHAVTDEAHRPARLFAGGIEAHVPQQHEDVHGGVPAAVPRRLAPATVGSLQGEQPRARALAGNPGALGRHLLRGRAGQVLQHLPADGRVGIKQPADDRFLRLRGLPFGWIDRHLPVLLPLHKRRCWRPNPHVWGQAMVPKK